METCLGGFLHDLLEDTETEDETVSSIFGPAVLSLIKANTKNSKTDKEHRNAELIERCAGHSESALIIKCADVLDNFEYYSYVQNEKGVNRCAKLGELILRFQKPEYRDPIFSEVRNMLSKIIPQPCL